MTVRRRRPFVPVHLFIYRGSSSNYSKPAHALSFFTRQLRYVYLSFTSKPRALEVFFYRNIILIYLLTYDENGKMSRFHHKHRQHFPARECLS